MDTVFLSLLNMSLTGGILILVVLVLRVLLRKLGAPAGLICCLWALAAVRLLCPVMPASSLSLMPERVAGGYAVEQWAEGYTGDVLLSHEGTPVYEAAVEAGIPDTGYGYVATTPDGRSPAPTVKTAWVPVLWKLWLCGVGAMAAYGIWSYLRLRRNVAAYVEEDGVRLCDHLKSPFLLGVFRPKVYLPSDLTGEARAAVLEHERAHLERRDHWWKALGFLCLALHWFNPLVWAGFELLCRDIELACDERVIRGRSLEERKIYSEALLSLSLPRRQVPVCPLAFGEVGVKERVKTVLHYKKPAFWAVIITVLAVLVTALCLLTGPAPAEGTLWLNGRTYTQSSRPRPEMPVGTLEIGRLTRLLSPEEENPEEIPSDGSAVGKKLDPSWVGVPIYQETPRQNRVWLAVSDGFAPFDAPEPPLLGDGFQLWEMNQPQVTWAEYPDVAFRRTFSQITAVNDNGHNILLGGDFLEAACAADLNGNGKREAIAVIRQTDLTGGETVMLAACGFDEDDPYRQLALPDAGDRYEFAEADGQPLLLRKSRDSTGTRTRDRGLVALEADGLSVRWEGETDTPGLPEISSAILTHFGGETEPGTVRVESHYLLGESMGCGAEVSVHDIFALPLCETYRETDHGPELVGGTCTPVRLEYTIDADGTRLTGIWDGFAHKDELHLLPEWQEKMENLDVEALRAENLRKAELRLASLPEKPAL